MEWTESYPADKQPSIDDMGRFVNSKLWGDINVFLQESYDAKPEIAYSGCAGQPGWNVKYRKGGRALCTLYPLDGRFIALVVVGSKEYDEALESMPECTPYTRELFAKTQYSAMGRWLMIEVTDESVLDDVKRLIRIRRKPSKR